LRAGRGPTVHNGGGYSVRIRRALAAGLVAAYAAGGGPIPRLTIIELTAFAFSVFTLYGCGAEPVFYGLILLTLGIPAFAWRRHRRT
jgi:basic amino acid/polyamine antiporter, APA family